MCNCVTVKFFEMVFYRIVIYCFLSYIRNIQENVDMTTLNTVDSVIFLSFQTNSLKYI